jgi:hypothetical protein
MIRGIVNPSRIGDSFGISLVMAPPDFQEHRILRLPSEPGRTFNQWEPYDPYAMDAEPTLRLAIHEIVALDDALGEVLRGTSDIRALRADLLVERARVDKSLDALIRIAGGKV